MGPKANQAIAIPMHESLCPTWQLGKVLVRLVQYLWGCFSICCSFRAHEQKQAPYLPNIQKKLTKVCSLVEPWNSVAFNLTLSTPDYSIFWNSVRTFELGSSCEYVELMKWFLTALSIASMFQEEDVEQKRSAGWRMLRPIKKELMMSSDLLWNLTPTSEKNTYYLRL